MLNPLGAKMSNPNKNMPCLEIEFPKFDADVLLPRRHHVVEFVNFLDKNDRNAQPHESNALGQDYVHNFWFSKRSTENSVFCLDIECWR